MPKANSQNSKIKMSILKAHGYQNQVWWSPAEQNSRSSSQVVAGMINRFLNNYALGKIEGKVNLLQFYENGILIHQHKIG